MDTQEAIGAAEPADIPEDTEDQSPPAERDYEAEARKHGWMPPEEFKGDKSKCVDAKTFVERADVVVPFLQKQNKAMKREIDDLKRQFKKASEHFSKAEERAMQRALADLQAKHNEAVETGDVAAANKAVKEMDGLKAETTTKIEAEEPDDPKQAQREFAEWVEQNDWYATDDKKRAYADIQAGAMGPATEYEGGPKQWLADLAAKVERKFAAKPTNPVNGGGNRPVPGKTGKGYADLPPEAKAACDKWVKQGLIKSREDYVRTYQF